MTSASDEDFKLQAIAIGLRKLLTGRSFYVNDFEELCRLAGAIPPAELLRTLHPLHCVSWADMPPAFRSELVRRIVEAIGTPGLPDVEITDDGIRVVEPPKLSWARRLLGGGAS